MEGWFAFSLSGFCLVIFPGEENQICPRSPQEHLEPDEHFVDLSMEHSTVKESSQSSKGQGSVKGQSSQGQGCIKNFKKVFLESWVLGEKEGEFDSLLQERLLDKYSKEKSTTENTHTRTLQSASQDGYD